ncbi:MAG TPA: Cof-type HAD-IIB family hydrolase [Candidatus Sulfotelmatobacter sp.]|nr:Cof-type HAD-IIB family hydrolase [Candidatus Sulfotelmatobacter sp.]
MPTAIDLIALDLDGTLLAPDETISPRNRAAIGEALAAGIRVVLVTGRGVDTPIRVSRELGLNLPVICCHGALTKDFGANRTLVHIPVPLVHAKPMLELADREGLAVAAYIDEAFYRLAGTPIVMDDMRGAGWHEVPSLVAVMTEAPTFIRFLGTESVRRMEASFGDLPLSFRYETWGELVECAVLSREASKRNALAKLCADFQVSPDRVMAVGDSRNDVPMLRWAKIGVAMANALPEVRQSVRYVTTSNAEDGVALAIERFCLPAKKKSA